MRYDVMRTYHDKNDEAVCVATYLDKRSALILARYLYSLQGCNAWVEEEKNNESKNNKKNFLKSLFCF